MKKLVILGAGESGVGAALLAQARGYDVLVSESGGIAPAFRQELQHHQISFEEGGHSEAWATADEVVKSPGIPQTTEVVRQIREKRIRISSEIDFASRFTSAKILAITGTNGKTTTTSLIYHLLKEAGYDVAVAGNIGKSFARTLFEGDHEYFVLEVSSFQLEDVHSFRPGVALLLNITRDHLDRYNGEMSAYAEAKFRITECMKEGDTFIYNADDEQIARVMNQREMPGIWMESFNEAYFQNNRLSVPRFYSPLFDDPDEQEQRPHEEYTDLPLKGRHNAMNIAAAILAVSRAGLEKQQIEAGLKTFKAVPHRLEEVGSINEISFVNDSKATNVEATAYALEAWGRPVIWIAGGVDKGNDYQVIDELVRTRVKSLICLGKDNTKLLQAFGESVSFISETTNIKEAVLRAYHLAEKGDVVLLSPACASFDLFKNYEDRGDQFRQAVQAHLAKMDGTRNINLK